MTTSADFGMGRAGHLLRELRGLHETPDHDRLQSERRPGRDSRARTAQRASGRQDGIGAPLFTLTGHTNAVNSAFFSPNSDRVITASTDHTARIWDAGTGESVKELTGHKGSLYKAMFSPDGKLALTVSLEKTARVWDAATGNLKATLSGHKDVVVDGVFSPDNRLVATRVSTARHASGMPRAEN